MRPILLSLVAWFGLLIGVSAAFAEGTLMLRHLEGERETEIRLTKSAATLRVEQLGESNLPNPVNLIDLSNGDVTILTPINQSVRTYPAAVFGVAKQPDLAPALKPLPGIGARPGSPGTPAQAMPSPVPGAMPPGIPGGVGQSGAPQRIGPDPSMLPPGVEIPQIPEMPAMPNPGAHAGAAGMPGAQLGAMAGGLPGVVPAVPGFPDLPDTGGPVRELVAHEDSRKIHGFNCRRHTLLLDRTTELTLWLSDHPDLPPFHLLHLSAPPRFGPRDPMQVWPAILRESGKFPMLVEMREARRLTGAEVGEPVENHEDRPMLASWEVVSIQRESPDPALFEIPETYNLIKR